MERDWAASKFCFLFRCLREVFLLSRLPQETRLEKPDGSSEDSRKAATNFANLMGLETKLTFR